MEVMILQSVYSLTIAITEIPSGYIADFFKGKIHLFLVQYLPFVDTLHFLTFQLLNFLFVLR